MSIENPYDISGSWKIDPDGRQDRSSGPCISRTMTKAEKIKYGMTVESEDDMKITKETVRQMAASGMSTAEIAEYFLPAYPNMKKQLMMAKVTMLLSDKKPGRQKVDTAEIVKNMLYVKHTTQSISNELQAAINSHENHPDEHTSIKEVAAVEAEEIQQKVLKEFGLKSLPENINYDEQYKVFKENHPEPEEAATIKETSEQAKKQVDNTAQESADKIKLSQAVDEMMEMVPDNVNHPSHYTAGGIEVTDYIQAKLTPEQFEGFCIGVIIQYVSRYRMKGGIEDLKKAEWYLSRIIGVMESA